MIYTWLIVHASASLLEGSQVANHCLDHHPGRISSSKIRFFLEASRCLGYGLEFVQTLEKSCWVGNCAKNDMIQGSTRQWSFHLGMMYTTHHNPSIVICWGIWGWFIIGFTWLYHGLPHITWFELLSAFWRLPWLRWTSAAFCCRKLVRRPWSLWLLGFHGETIWKSHGPWFAQPQIFYVSASFWSLSSASKSNLLST